MIIYIDELIFLNFTINYSFIKIIYILFNEKVNTSRIIISSLISIIMLFSFLLNYSIYNIIKIIGGIIIIFTAFKYSNKKRFIIMTTLYYLLQFSFIGVLSIFNVKGWSVLLFLLLICLLILIYSKKSNIYNEKTYKVIIRLVNETIVLNGFLDTGNKACYYEKPIVFLDYKYYSNQLSIYTTVKIKTVNEEQYINCYIPEKFYIIDNNKKIEKEVLIAFTSFDDNINCLLNNLLFI